MADVLWPARLTVWKSKRADTDFILGRWGKKVGRGAPIDYIFETEEEILSAIEKTILFYRENGVAGERFADTIARVGFSKAKEAVLSDEILKRKEEILKDE